MSLWTRLRSLIAGRSAPSLAPRHERREAARQRHHETGEPAWTAGDRHLGPDGEHVVADVTPGTPGHYGSVHTGRDD
jgi:cell wall assembly regulator SMI1